MRPLRMRGMNLGILRMLEDTFSLDVLHLWNMNVIWEHISSVSIPIDNLKWNWIYVCFWWCPIYVAPWNEGKAKRYNITPDREQ